MCGFISATDAQGRRVRLRARPAPISEDQLQYYEAEPRAGDQDIDIEDELALYGRQPAARQDYRPAAQVIKPRTKEAPRAPPVQTIRNYNKVNDDGSFTFGYEAADGSFKEETRGTDCVVRGKYGYVDPDGNKREFTYVSGNPCDPNAANEEDEELEKAEEESNEAAGEPANYPTRSGNYPTRAPVQNYPTRASSRPAPIQTTARPATTVFQNLYEAEDETEAPRTYRPPRPQATPLAITPRPLPPATTFRPQLLQITQRPQNTPIPQIVYSSPTPTPIASPRPTFDTSSYRPSGHIDFAAEFAKFQQENQIVSSTPATYKTKAKTSEPISQSGNPIYSTQLIFDPSSGQYDSNLFQSLPQSQGGLTLNQRVPRPTPSQPQLIQQQPQGFNPSPLYRPRLQHPVPLQQQLQPQQLQPQQRSPQEVYQRQQAGLQFQNSAQLYAQQQQLQQSQLQQDRQAARAALAQPSQQPQQQYYFVAPGREQGAGPIDAFLRGHGIPY